MNDVVPARKSGVYAIEVADEVVVYDREEDRAHRLNPTAAAVWRHCDGRASLDDVAAALREEFGRQPPEDLVWLALGQLEEAGLLVEEINGDGADRRDAVNIAPNATAR